MKILLPLILLLSIGLTFAEVDGSTCDVIGLSGLASSACSENCENQDECSNALALLTSEAERCGCDSECQEALDESRLISARCEAEEEDENDETEDDDEDEIDDESELDKKKKKKKNKKSKGKKKGKKGKGKNNKMMKKLKKWKRKLRQCRAITSARGGSKQKCVSCCVKSIVLYAVTEEFDLASVPEDVRRQREQVYEDLMNQNVENKMLDLVSSGVVEESEEKDLAELEEDEDEDDLEEDDEDEVEETEDDEEDLDEEDEIDESDELDKKKKKKKKKKNNKKNKKMMMKKKKKAAKKACRKQLGLVFAYALASTSEALTLEQAKESLAIQSLDFDELEEPVEDEEEEELEEDEDNEENVDLDELDKKKKKKKTKVTKKKAKKAAKRCCPSRVKSSSFEHRYVKHF